MSLSDCSNCWETPCVCHDGSAYKHLSINELTVILKAIEAIIADKARRGVDPEARGK